MPEKKWIYCSFFGISVGKLDMAVSKCEKIRTFFCLKNLEDAVLGQTTGAACHFYNAHYGFSINILAKYKK